MERLSLTINTSGPVRRAFRGNREYLVAPLTLIVPGVLSGSQGPIYYPPDEIARDPHGWEGIPLLAYHPQLPSGEHVSANHAGIVEKQGIGFVSKPAINPAKQTLGGEGWFDVERVAKVDPRILNALKAGQPIELSTGLFIQRRDEAPLGANHNGQGYTHIGRDYRPDHVAILPDQLGACSIRDGCGVLVNQLVCNSAGPDSPSVVMKPGDRFEVVRIGNETLYRLVANASEGTGGASSETKNPTPAQPHPTVKPPQAGTAEAASTEEEYQERVGKGAEPSGTASGTSAGSGKEPAANARDVSVVMNELDTFLIYNARWNQEARDRLSTEAPEDFAGPHQSFPIRSQEDVDHAARLIGHADDPEAVKSKIKTIAKRKGLTIPDSWKDASKPAENAKGASNPIAQEPPAPAAALGGTTVTNEQLKTIAANCRCEATKKELLALVHNSPLKAPENMNDAELKNHHQRVVSEVARRHAGMDADPDAGQDTEAGANGGYTDAEPEPGQSVANDVEMHSFDGPKGSGKEMQAGGAGTSSEYPKTTQNAASVEEWLKKSQAPAAVREMVRNSFRMERETKLALVRRMVANVRDDKARNALGNLLMAKSLLELRDLSQLGAARENTAAPEPHYFGSTPAYNQNTTSAGVPVDKDFLTPTMNWREGASPYLTRLLDGAAGGNGTPAPAAAAS